MNRLTKGLLTVSLVAALAGTAAACGSSGSWKGTDFMEYGDVVAETNGGFVAETTKYVYFINGIESSYSDNTFGTPVKGSLVAADKSDLTKSQVIVPELMSASDYGAGIYLFNGGDGVYAYYGTPNTEKDSSGSVANSKMTFKRTRLDGTKNEKLFTVSSLSLNYRMAQAEDGAVYIVYYDADSSAIVSYNCSTGKSVVIAKTDVKTNEKTENGEYLSLGEYKFLENGNAAQIVYTITAYTQEYYAAQEEQEDSYSRQTAPYNYIYTYTAGKDAECVKNGSAVNETYALKSTVDDYLFYTATPLGGTAKTYGVKIDDFGNATEIGYPDNVKDGMVIKSLDRVYYFDSDAKQVVENTLIKDAANNITEYEIKRPILKDETVSKLIDVDDNYIYCFNSDGYIVAIERAGEERTIRISERTASSSWYDPETVKISDTEEYILYCDNSSDGSSYVYRTDLKKLNDPKAEDTDEDEADDLFYLESAFVGVMPAKDKASVVSAKINAIGMPLADIEKGEDGKYRSESVEKARAAYTALDDDAKSYISDSELERLVKAEKALALADTFIKLEKVADFNNLDETEKAALKTEYEAAKAVVAGLGDDYEDIADFLGDKLNLNYFYYQAGKKFSE